MNVSFFVKNSYSISALMTKRYSTSFSLATSLLEKKKREAIYAVYGFVRLADEIVDSFDGYDKEYLLNRLEEDLAYTLANGISNNTILVAFADTVKKFGIDKSYMNSFLASMKMDLSNCGCSTQKELDAYIYGSADVVGLMCLKIFCGGSDSLFCQLEMPARKLGSAFQKVNFLRDLRIDIHHLGRSYFPELENTEFDNSTKKLIEISIQSDFDEARKGIRQLPGRSKLAVSLAYFYYVALFNKIKRKKAAEIMSGRIRISNAIKYMIFIKTAVMYLLRMI